MLRNRKENNKTPDKTSKISYNFCASRQETVLIDIHRIYNKKHDEEQLKFSKRNQKKANPSHRFADHSPKPPAHLWSSLSEGNGANRNKRESTSIDQDSDATKVSGHLQHDRRKVLPNDPHWSELVHVHGFRTGAVPKGLTEQIGWQVTLQGLCEGCDGVHKRRASASDTRAIDVRLRGLKEVHVRSSRWVSALNGIFCLTIKAGFLFGSFE